VAGAAVGVDGDAGQIAPLLFIASSPASGRCPHCIVAGAGHVAGTGKISGSDSTDRSAAV
jgi:hypothetical protein